VTLEREKIADRRRDGDRSEQANAVEIMTLQFSDVTLAIEPLEQIGAVEARHNIAAYDPGGGVLI
jgi:hypothetical protein